MNGNYLRTLRQDAGLSQKAMAEKLGYFAKGVPNRSHISRIEGGHQAVTERLVLAVKYVCEKHKANLPIEYAEPDRPWQEVLAEREDDSNDVLNHRHIL
jgi:transcriptional regulator with XRE-family HTH domain